MKQPLALSHYHSALRIALCVIAIVLVFDSGLIDKRTTTLSNGAMDYLASAVGVYVGVAPNDVNILTARITELEQELASKDREIAVGLNTTAAGGQNSGTSTLILSVILFILLVLIVLNYVLDYLRGSRNNIVNNFR